MKEALKEAEKASEEDEVPIGSVVIKDNVIIGRGHNMKERLNDPTAHAEMIAITAASNSISDWRLTDAILYSTIEPCLMCAGAIIQSRLSIIVYGARDVKFGVFGSRMDIRDMEWNWEFEVVEGIMEKESAKMLGDFFRERRDG